MMILTVAAARGQAAEYYVAPTGDDNAPGTKESPFHTVQKAADTMVAGDTCFLREGTYRETVRPKEFGQEGSPIRFVAYPGEKAIIDGTEPVDGNWTLHKGKIYKTTVARPIVQLFVDGKMMIEARWPNVRFGELMDIDKWRPYSGGSDFPGAVFSDLS